MDQKDYEELEELPTFCAHTLIMVSAIRTSTSGGYRIECLRCKLIGPERESYLEALRALRRMPYRKASDQSDGI